MEKMPSQILDLSSIIDTAGESLHVGGSLDMSEFAVGTVVFDLADGIHFELTAMHAGEGILISGSASADVRVSCSRCLADFEDELVGEISSYFTFDPGAVDDEAGVALLEGESVDVAPLVMAAIVEVAPFAPLCDEECKGLCPQCGADLNTETCDCGHDTKPENPFSVLEGMFEEKE